jgi:hypothetical protein
MGQEPYNMQPPSVFSNSIHPSHRLQPAKKQRFAVKAVHSPRNASVYFRVLPPDSHQTKGYQQLITDVNAKFKNT